MSLSKVSLTASMRTNLRSLQTTKKLQDKVQLRLSTGLKVNSAIDNPSSYYTATALDNRASDLSALLDSMSQGVQTIKTATTALSTISDFLEQSTAMAQQAVEDAVHQEEVVFSKPVMAEVNEADAEVTKEWLLANGADSVVTTEAELIEAIDGGSEGDVIVIMGNITIDLKDDYSNSLILQQGQKLVGTEYFAGSSSKAGIRNEDGSRLSSLTFTNSSGVDISAIQMEDGSVIQNLDISYTASQVKDSRGVIEFNMPGTATVKDVDISLKNENPNEITAAYLSAIYVDRSDVVMNLDGVVNIKTEGAGTQGIFARSGTTTMDPHKATINITGQTSIVGSGKSYGLSSFNSRVNIKSGSQLAVKSDFALIDGRGIKAEADSNIILENSTNNLFSSFVDAPPQISLQRGSVISAKTPSVNATWEVKDDADINMSVTDLSPFRDNFTKIGAAKDTHFSDLIKDIVHIKDSYVDQYAEILNQIDMVANDAHYKGINLLREDDLNVRFNEDGSSKILVDGVDGTTKGLGLTDVVWTDLQQIQISIDELRGAINKVRRYTEEFGNTYSVIENREKFTENLINILTEGADKLTLADMNEEAANSLALQTRQQLAINSLSLAGKANQGMLKLFQ